MTPKSYVPAVRMPRACSRLAVASVMAAGGVAALTFAPTPATHLGAPRPAAVVAQGVVLPAFIANHGQFPEEVVFAWRHARGETEFRAGQVVHHLSRANCKDHDPAAVTPYTNQCSATIIIEIGQPGTLPAQPKADAVSDAVVSFLIGADSGRWQHELPTHNRIRYPEVAPGIDLAMDHVDGRLKGTWFVAPGADPATIRWRYLGAEFVRIASDGSLRIKHARDQDGGLVLGESPPVAWQDTPLGRQDVTVNYQLEAGYVGFDVSDYDPAYSLVIDPEIVFVAHLGDIHDDQIASLSVNDLGQTMVVGRTTSNRFPKRCYPTDDPQCDESEPSNPDVSGQGDVFVSKLDANGELMKTIFLGSNTSGKGSAAQDVLWEPDGHVIVIGTTSGDNFPNTDNKARGERKRRVIQGAKSNPSNTNKDMFITKLDFDSRDELQTGAHINYDGPRIPPEEEYHTYSTYIGSSGEDTLMDAALDGDGNLIVVGHTTSTSLFNRWQACINAAGDDTCEPNVPRLPPAQAYKRAAEDAVVFAISPLGDKVRWATFLGGEENDKLSAVAIGHEGRIWLAGQSNSDDFCRDENCTVNPPPGRISRGEDMDMFVAVLGNTAPNNHDGRLRMERLVWLGGGGSDQTKYYANDLVAHGSDRVVLGGKTHTGRLSDRSSYARLSNGFVASLSIDGDDLAMAWHDMWTTHNAEGLPNSNHEVTRVRIDDSENIYAYGISSREVESIDRRYPDNPAISTAQLSIYTQDGSAIYHARLNRRTGDVINATAFDLGPGGAIWMGGYVTGAIEGPPAPPPPFGTPGKADGFVARIAGLPIATETPTRTASPTSSITPPPTATDMSVAIETPSPTVPPTLTPIPDQLYFPMVFGPDPCPPQDLFSDVVLILDSSTSMLAPSGLSDRMLRDVAQEAALAFVTGMLGGGYDKRLDKVAIVSFDRSARVLSRFTRDIGDLNAAIRQAYDPVVGSSLDDALTVGIAQFDDRGIAMARNRKVIILMSDGFVVDLPDEVPGTSEQAVHTLVTEAREAGITIYAIGVGTKLNEPLLRYIASPSQRGVNYYLPIYRAADLVPIFERLSAKALCPDEIYMR